MEGSITYEVKAQVLELVSQYWAEVGVEGVEVYPYRLNDGAPTGEVLRHPVHRALVTRQSGEQQLVILVAVRHWARLLHLLVRDEQPDPDV